MGLPAAIVGSSVIGGIGSIFGARSANKAAQNNARAAAENAGYANQVLRDAQPIFDSNAAHGRNAMVGGLRQGQNAWWNRMSPVADMAEPALNNIASANPNYGGNTQIGGHWDNLQSQNFLQSPDYKFRMKEGLDAVQNSAAAGGAGLYSGNTLRGIADYASNLASGEYGNWFNRQSGIADRKYGADVANYDRDYGQFQGNWGRGQDQNRYLAGQGINALNQGAQLDLGTETGIGQTEADFYGRLGQNEMDVARQISGNYMGNAQTQANTPYVSPWGGINQAVQGGLQNYLWAQNAGLWGQRPGGVGGGTKVSVDPNTMYGRMY